MSFKAVLEADISNWQSNLNKAGVQLEAFDKKVKEQFKGLNYLGDSFINVGKKASILSVALVAAGGKAFSMAADFQDALGATEQIFKDNSDTVQNWANNLDTSYGIAKKEALEYSNLMGSMLINIGKLTEEQATKQSAKLIELAGDLTAMYGGTTQDAVRALTGALKGNNTMLDNYGMAVNDALIKQKALEMGLISGTSEMSLQAKQAATLALIWEQTGAAQGQAAREADGASGAMRAFRTEVANLSTELGEVLLPIITPMISKLTDFVSGLRALSPEMQSLIVGVAGATAVAGPLLIVIGNILKALPLIKAAIVALTGPIGIVVGAIVAGTTLIIANWDELKNASRNVVKYIKDDWNVLKNGFEEDTNWFAYRWGQIKNLFKDQSGNPDQALLNAALAANEMTGSMGDNKKAVEETIQPTIDLTKANEDLAKSQEKVVESLKAMRLVIPQKEIYSLFNELFTQSGNELILNPLIEPNIDSATLKSKMYESVKSAMGDLSEGIKVLTIDMTSMVTDIIDSAFFGIADAIANKENVIASLGASLLAPLGNILSQLGKMLITTGAGFEALQKMFANPFGGGLGAIAAGVALMALGAAAKAGASAIMANQSKSSGYSSAPSLRNTGPTLGNSDYRGQYQDDFKVEFKIGTNELVGVLNTAEQRRNRL